MAYKDEYEVARLALDPAFDARLAQEFGAGAKRSIRLHPPLLRAMGLKNKLSLGAWVDPGFRALRSMRRIRGTRLDIFGYHHIRRMERELVAEYREVMETLLPELNPDNHAIAVEIAELPDMIPRHRHRGHRSSPDRAGSGTYRKVRLDRRRGRYACCPRS